MEEAIRLWQEENPKDPLPPHYCFNWVLCMAELHKQTNFQQEYDQQLLDKIGARIKAVTGCEALAKVLNENQTVKCWVDRNYLVVNSDIVLKPTNSNGVCRDDSYVMDEQPLAET